MHRLERTVTLNISPQRLWEFIATPANLNELTPPDLHFTILSEVPVEMANGLRLHYEITLPLLGRQHWLTEIRDIVDGHAFVDVQLEGPYRHWEHRHEISPAGDHHTMMRDVVNYTLPCGIAGEIVHELWVKGQLQRIFDYRELRLKELFN